MPSLDKLREALGTLVSDDPKLWSVQRFFDVCYHMALPYLNEKRRVGQIHLPLGTSLGDLAIDSIAELFQRDSSGRYFIVREYFEGLEWATCSKDELIESIRRLVFTVVNDNLFRNFREIDPSLSKIIRNLKLAAKSNGHELSRVNDNSWIGTGVRGTELPGMPPEFMAIHLARYIRSGVNVRFLYSAAIEILQHQSLYRKAMPLIQLAQSIRLAMATVNDVDSPPDPTLFRDEETEWLIHRSVEGIRGEMYSTYVAKNKLDETSFDAYLKAIEERLYATYIAGEEYDLTNFQALSMFIPGLTREAYYRDCRATFEYLLRKTRDNLVRFASRELNRAI